MKYIAGLLGLLIVSAPVLAASAPPQWREGVHYSVIMPAQPTGLPPGKVEVTEVFSYACPYCNAFAATADALKASLPANAQMDYLPASFSPAEDFPMFQRAFFTAQALGVAAREHDAMFDAVWKTGELAVSDPRTHAIRHPLPTLEDAAMFYQRQTGIPAAKFMATAQSFWVASKIANCDRLIGAYQIDGTPSVIVNGKYRVNMEAVRTPEALIQLVNYLVKQESQ
jgi:thiol:disulfide interchange protein DsbA